MNRSRFRWPFHLPSLALAPTEVADVPGDLQGFPDRGGERMVAPDESMELLVQDVADRRLQGEALFVRALGIGPLDPVGEFEPGRSPLGVDLETGLGQEPSGLPPGVTVI